MRQRRRFEHNDVAWIKAEPQPALKQRGPHFARANQNQKAREITQIRTLRILTLISGRHASPVVSNIAESIASRGDLPAQITN